ncbi:ATP-binding cassette domain-containing protein [Staphylococcus sp. NRL 16/872]|uniref:ATP-binding cassette domain-containing protein n=1 Tax=Staphylococcus sp. NRL 16/872 TaxID=2930131 RepID=UPI001FB48B6C|nr:MULTISPECIES: ATP-binding cassette domain-containing protein [unclassified Staphylococcus]MCJ1655248.1 ATP-binding cassette domain-containing protein [Staphylococcus sp. NRL 21/187]MCJ1661081.1 ATP-binding cassette domain-containing protein [Staphylococcus sp. NRL 18/288]MCJ1666979.1 ATP-binding cassette domain-containing protein [Staphylococcus sp. NRL 19/737]WEN70532.1 ATP-binding cassette domain-containing protein [Staphylococcus sp. NRL 16/872]
MPNHQQKDNPIVNVERLSVFDNERTLIDSVSLKVNKGDFHCIIGESGSGKSLLTRTILGMKRDNLRYQGSLDIDLNKTDAVFQDVYSNMFQNVTIGKHFQYLFEATKSKLSSTERTDWVIEQIRLLGLNEGEKLLKRYPFEMSGGMAQRIAFIMSLIRRPAVLFLDESTSALDTDNVERLMSYLIEARQRYGMTIIFITHDINLVRNYATHMSIMKNGRVIESGDAKSILDNPTELYTQKLIEIAHRRRDYARN